MLILFSHNVNSKGEKAQSRKRLDAPTLKRYLGDNIFNMLPNEVPMGKCQKTVSKSQ